MYRVCENPLPRALSGTAVSELHEVELPEVGWHNREGDKESQTTQGVIFRIC